MNTDYPTNTFGAQSPTGVNLEQLFVGVPWAFKYNEKHAFSIMPVFVYQTFEAQGVGSFAPFSSAPTKLSNNGQEHLDRLWRQDRLHGPVVREVQLRPLLSDRDEDGRVRRLCRSVRRAGWLQHPFDLDRRIHRQSPPRNGLS